MISAVQKRGYRGYFITLPSFIIEKLHLSSMVAEARVQRILENQPNHISSSMLLPGSRHGANIRN